MDGNLKWYLEAIVHELSRLDNPNFVGNIDFKFNIIKGKLTNMNIVLNKSIKKPYENNNNITLTAPCDTLV